MIDNHYQDPRLADLYDLDSGWSQDRDFYLSLADRSGMDILDLGCGTGLLCDAYAAEGHRVTGVDPSAAMLDVARKKTHGAGIEWMESTAQNFKSDKRFDLIIMTGHAFQVLLNDIDVLDTFAVMRDHLKPDGRIVFESRNPRIDWSKIWDYELTLQLPDGRVQESRNMISLKNNRMRFELRYKFSDQEIVSTSELRFMSRAEIENCLAQSGLRAEALVGNWNAAPFDEETSEEMIFIVTAQG